MKQFDISGMSCAACSARVEKVTGAVPGVEKAEVNLLAGSMQVAVPPVWASFAMVPQVLILVIRLVPWESSKHLPHSLQWVSVKQMALVQSMLQAPQLPQQYSSQW